MKMTAPSFRFYMAIPETGHAFCLQLGPDSPAGNHASFSPSCNRAAYQCGTVKSRLAVRLARESLWTFLMRDRVINCVINV